MSQLLVDDSDGIRTITFHRPEARNALTVAMRRQFCDLVDAVDRDPTLPRPGHHRHRPGVHRRGRLQRDRSHLRRPPTPVHRQPRPAPCEP